MKRHILLILSLLLLIASTKTNAQILITKNDSIPLGQDSIIKIILPEVRGNIQWQKSLDTKSWINIEDQTNDTILIKPDTAALYRAIVTDGTCLPVYSDTLRIMHDTFQIKIKDIVTVNFPAGSILTANPTVEKISDNNLQDAFDLISELFEVNHNISYQIKININNLPPQNDMIEVSINIPDEFLASVPSDYTIELFASTYQNGGEEILDNFELITSSYDETNKILVAKLPRWVFTNERNGEFETFLILASRPGKNKLRSGILKSFSEEACNAFPIMCPLSSCNEVTSPYNLFRVHPITGKVTSHWGTDFKAKIGNPVYAVEDGKVVLIHTQVDDIGNVTGYGLYIIIKLDNNKGSVLYGHLSESMVSLNQSVHKNQQIAKSGNSGLSKGPHLHFEYVPSGWIIESKGRINPVPCITEDEGNIETGTFTDSRDGKIYKTVKIGNQWWMAENLAYLPNVSPPSISSESSPYYYVYDYNGASVSEAKATNNYETYGVLYNWPAAVIACPNGWHLPSANEWEALYNFFGGKDVAGGKLKEAGTLHWSSPNFGATNESEFTALPGGYTNGIFQNVGDAGDWWTSTLYSPGAKSTFMSNDRISCGLLDGWYYFSLGMSVRCIKDK